MRTQDAERAGAFSSDPSSLSGGTPGGATGILGDLSTPLGRATGAWMTDDHRYYWNGDGPKPSVTTVLKVLDKPAVTNWIARETARAAYRNPMAPNLTEDEYVSFLLAQPREVTDVAAKLGSSVHLLADMVGRPETGATGFEIPEQAQPYLAAFRGFLAFLRAQGGEIVSSEKAVFSNEGYAGTYDLLVYLHRPFDELWMVDIKTSKGYYPEYALQLAAYGMADFIGLPGDPTEYPMPRVDRYGVLHLRPDQYPDTGWRLVEYPVEDRDRLAFLAALSLYIWKGEGRFTKSILQKAIVQGQLEGIGTDPLAKE